MTEPNVNTLWASVLVDELAESGIRAACISPGSRSTPLSVAFAAHPEIETFSHLDERSSAFFGLGKARRTGTPTALVCTSGTAAANFHPAVLEASESRVPMVVLTADRPRELLDSGANQTTDQTKLYGDAVRWFRSLADPEADGRKLRSLRTTAARAVANARNTPAGPVHLNVPFRKPLEPTPVPDDIPDDFDNREPLATKGRDGPFVSISQGRSVPDEATLDSYARAIDTADRGLIVCGPTDNTPLTAAGLRSLAESTGFPVLADPLSGHRFGPQIADIPVCGGYDSYLDGAVNDIAIADPDIVIRFGASPTSKVLRKYLAAVETQQVIVDPAGGWREAEFTASDLVISDPTAFATKVSRRLSQEAKTTGRSAYQEQFMQLERAYWSTIEDETDRVWFEGAILATVCAHTPDPSTVFVSNSMPVRDMDRFGKPRTENLTVLGNRGVSGIDGITSTALGAGSATDDPLVLVTGDLAFYHDMNGLLALDRCGVDATIVLIDNDGGGIFNMLPIAEFDPPFTEQFQTPHGLDFEPVGSLYGCSFERIDSPERFETAFEESVSSDETEILCLTVDGERSHEIREQLHERVRKERGKWLDGNK